MVRQWSCTSEPIKQTLTGPVTDLSDLSSITRQYKSITGQMTTNGSRNDHVCDQWTTKNQWKDRSDNRNQ